MTSDYQIYRDATSRISQGWMQRGFSSFDNTNYCLVGAVLAARGTIGTDLPAEDEARLHAELSNYRGYRLLHLLCRHGWLDIPGFTPTQRAIMWWNDMPGRRKSEVKSVLDAITFTLAVDEIAALRIRLTKLETDKARLEARVEELVRENSHLIRRLFNYMQLRETRHLLTELTPQVDDLDRELAELMTAHPAV